MWAGVRQLLRDPHVVTFYALGFLGGLGNGCTGYLLLYLRELGKPGLGVPVLSPSPMLPPLLAQRLASSSMRPGLKSKLAPPAVPLY